MKRKKIHLIKKLFIGATTLTICGAFAGNALATNGYFSHAYSIKNKGMAGAGVALPLDSLTAATNPAGLTEVGNRFDVGLSLFSPNREYTVDRDPTAGPPAFELAGGTVESDSNYFLIPSIGWSRQLSDRSAIGVAVFGNGGMNTDYPTQTYYDTSSSTAGVDLMQLFIAPTFATKLGDKHSFGITPIIAAQFFSEDGLASLGAYSADSTKLANNGYESSFGFGGRVGYLGKLTDKFSVGLAAQSKIYMQEFDDYAGLFAEQGDFDIPANWTVGFAVNPTPAVTIAFDVQHIYYSDVNSVGNPMLPNLAVDGLGPDGGAGFGWDDMTIYKIGLQWARTAQWTYRFGYSYGEQPIPAAEVLFGILAPAVIEQHASFGFTYTFAKLSELDFSLTYAFENDVTGPNPLAASPQDVTLTMNQWEAALGYSWKF